MATLDGDEQPLTTGVLAEEVPLPDDPWEHGNDPWRRSPDMHSGGMNAATGTPPPGFGNGDEVVGGSFPGGPAGPPVSYGPVMTANGGFGMAGPCQCPGPFVPQGPGGCGGSCQFAGPGVCAGAGGCAGPGVPLGPTVSQGPCPLPGYGVSWSWDAPRLWRIPADGNAVWWLWIWYDAELAQHDDDGSLWGLAILVKANNPS